MSAIKSFISGMTLILLIASILLGGLLYLQWEQLMNSAPDQIDVASAEVPPAKRKREPPIQPFMPIPLSGFSEILARPLFTEGRTPPEAPVEEKTVNIPTPPPELKLEGVAVTPQSKTAVITDLRTNELLRLSEGMSHQDWKVESVGTESVTIRRGAQEIILKLELESDAAGAAAAKPPFRLPLRRRPPVVSPAR